MGTWHLDCTCMSDPLGRCTVHGKTVCPACGQSPDSSDLRWRWNGDRWWHRHDDRPMNRLEVELKSGGTLAVTSTADAFSLGPEERTLVFGISDLIAAYEAAKKQVSDA